MKKALAVSVAEFALPVPRAGHIETHSGYGHLPRVGNELHRALQRERENQNSDYESEKWVSHTFCHGSLQLCVSGRIDGIFRGPPVRIEEIKSAYDVDKLRHRLLTWGQHPYHLQTATYAYILYQQTGRWPAAAIHLVSAVTGETSGDDIPIALSLADYEVWLSQRLEEIVREVAEHRRHTKTFANAAKALRFPYQDLRSGQEQLMHAVTDALKGTTPLLLQAPTGLGKTLGVLYPALRESLSHRRPLLYLTPKNTQHLVAEDALDRLRATTEKPLLRSLTLHAKSKMCLQAEPLCNPERCEFARDYYKKLADHQIVKSLRKKKKLSRRDFLRAGEKYEVCPFELQLEMLPWSHAVICDYNYVFSPTNSIKRFGHIPYRPVADKDESAPVLVLDEVHNLVARAMDYFSAELHVNDLDRLIFAVLSKLPQSLLSAKGPLEDFLAFIKSFAPSAGMNEEEREFPLLNFQVHQKKILDVWSEALANNYLLEKRDPFLQIINAIEQFVTTLSEWALEPQGWCSFAEHSRWGVRLRLRKFDVADHLQSIYQQFPQMIGFSATLKPFLFYRRLLGLENERVRTLELPFPFAKENRRILIVPQVSTKYSQRSFSLPKLCELVKRVTALKAGNYAIFFPSFEYLQNFVRLFTLQISPQELRLLVQERDLAPQKAAEILESLRSAAEPTLLIGVQGGVFAEGVDYLGEMLLGAFVVGPPLAIFNYENEKIRKYFDDKFGEGFNYTYAYPAMAKAIQAAGRVVRSNTDRGIIVLLDQRFLAADYTHAMPQDWFDHSVHELVSQQILQDLTDFWSVSPATSGPPPLEPDHHV